MTASKIMVYTLLPWRIFTALVVAFTAALLVPLLKLCPEFVSTFIIGKKNFLKSNIHIVYLKVHLRDPQQFWQILKTNLRRTMEERLAAAQRMLDLEPLECPVLVDLLTDETSKTYGSVPERLYIVQDGVIVYKGGQGPNNYKLAEVEEWLEKYKGQ